MWTSNNNTSYITITTHFINLTGSISYFVLDTHAFGNIAHTGDNLDAYFRATIKNWELSSKVTAIVTDNAYNITNAVRNSSYKSIRCAAHTIQLCIRDVIDNDDRIVSLLAKCRSIVGYFKRSTKGYELFRSIQKE